MSLSQRDVERWIRPHPVGFSTRSAQWDIKVLSVAAAARKLRCWWNHSEHTVAWWARRAVAGKSPLEGHYLLELARSWAPTAPNLTVLATMQDRKPPARGRHWTVVDGNHRLIALEMVRLQTRPVLDSKTLQTLPGSTAPTHVAVLCRR